MSSSDKNLSDFGNKEIPDASALSFGIICAEWNTLPWNQYQRLLLLDSQTKKLTLKSSLKNDGLFSIKFLLINILLDNFYFTIYFFV
jgi:hypothetical protein